MVYVTIDSETLQELANIARSYAHDAKTTAERAEQRGEGFNKVEMYTAVAKNAGKHADAAQEVVNAAWRQEQGHTWQAAAPKIEQEPARTPEKRSMTENRRAAAIKAQIGYSRGAEQMIDDASTTGPLREAWRRVMDDYAQTWKWIRRPVTKPPTGAFFIFGSLLAASASFLLLGVRL